MYGQFIGALATLVAAHSLLAADDPVPQILDHVRQATGWSRLGLHPQGVQLSGDATMAGTKARFVLLFNESGSFAQHIQGPIPMSTGFDGQRAWIDDIGGERRLLGFGDREQAIMTGLILTYGWLSPAAPLEFKPAEGDNAAAAMAFALKGGEIAGTITIDRATWLPRAWSYTVAGREYTFTFSGKLELDGITFPAVIERGGSSGMSMRITLDKAADAPQFIRSPFEPVLSRAGDVTFEAAAPAALEIKKAPTGHVLVHPLVDGKDLGWFIFDTGAGSNCIDRRAAEALGVEQFGEIPAVGVSGITKATLCRPGTLKLGRATMDKPLMVVLDLAFLDTYMGEKIAGIVGYGMLHRTIAEIDMEAPAVSLYDPAAYDGSKLAWTTLAIDDRVACVEAEFEGHKGWFHLDTGAGSSNVQIHAPAVTRLKLLEGRDTAPSTQGGVGGMSAARQGKLEWFQLGGRRTQNVSATFAIESKGAFATPYTLGNIGGGLVRPFTLVMDYQGGRIAFVERTPR
jgi:predicted aspartyl protease